jgi:hypothetical protein
MIARPTPILLTVDPSSATQLNSKPPQVKASLLLFGLSFLVGPYHSLISELLIGIQDLHDPAVTVGEEMVVIVREVVEDSGELTCLILGKIELLPELFGIHRETTALGSGAVESRMDPIAHHDGAKDASAEKDQQERNDSNPFGGARQSDGGHT